MDRMTFFGDITVPDSPESRILIPGKPGHRIVIVDPDTLFYEHVETGELTPIATAPPIAAFLRSVLKP
jgi:hypothetical protein